MFRMILIALMATVLCSPIASAYMLIAEYNIVYAEVAELDGDGALRTEQLKLDMYRPNIRTGRAPVLVYTYGGCFIRGSKSKIPTFLKKLSNAGVAVAPVDYRMGKDSSNPEAAGLWNWPYPAGLKDVQQAVRFLRRNKDRWALDTDRMAAHGESAGGYLAAALGVRPVTDRQDCEDEFSRRFGIVSDWRLARTPNL
jgi:acetyl esterase/lipase